MTLYRPHAWWCPGGPFCLCGAEVRKDHTMVYVEGPISSPFIFSTLFEACLTTGGLKTRGLGCTIVVGDSSYDAVPGTWNFYGVNFFGRPQREWLRRRVHLFPTLSPPRVGITVDAASLHG